MTKNNLKNDLLLRTLGGEITERVPVWMMRQAGRYLPEYIRLRNQYSFFERVENPELACEITLQPVNSIGVDAAILFSDILVVPQAMGLEVQLVENTGPWLPDPVRSEGDFKRIGIPDVKEKLHYVFDAIRLTKQELNGRVPLIGFAGAPWTIFCYMVQGGGSKNFDKAKAFCFQHPKAAHHLLQMITDTTIAYLKEQIVAGVDALQIFDSWGGLWGKSDFETYSLPYIRQIVSGLNSEVPVIVFAKGAWQSIPEMANTGARGLGIDWCIEPETARQLAGNDIVLQGNFDPAKLLAPIAEIKKETQLMLEKFGKRHYIANLGHGILPNIPVDHARAFVDSIQSFKW